MICHSAFWKFVCNVYDVCMYVCIYFPSLLVTCVQIDDSDSNDSHKES